MAHYSGKSTGVLVHRLHAVAAEQIILPPATLELLERNVFGFFAQRENLADRFPGVAERLHQLVVERREMDRSRATEAPTMELDEDRIEKLKALGYLQ